MCLKEGKQLKKRVAVIWNSYIYEIIYIYIYILANQVVMTLIELLASIALLSVVLALAEQYICWPKNQVYDSILFC